MPRVEKSKIPPETPSYLFGGKSDGPQYIVYLKSEWVRPIKVDDPRLGRLIRIATELAALGDTSKQDAAILAPACECVHGEIQKRVDSVAMPG